MYKSVVKGKGGISAKVVADSINEKGDRITTFELEYHRYIHGEVMTHRLFSRNAMSSRAVPVSKMIEQLEDNMAKPIHWGAAQKGMQADTEVENFDSFGQGEYQWEGACYDATVRAKTMLDQGYHKQIVNRLLEPFQMMKVVLTATEFANFFWLRLDKDAQPEIQELARCMKEAREESTPDLLKVGEWHVPYIIKEYAMINPPKFVAYLVKDDGGFKVLTKEEAIAISSSCCAQVSYRNIDNSFEKAMTVYERLGVGGNKIHASPFEHIASPMKVFEFDYNNPELVPEQGVTHTDTDQNYWSGNFKGWVQHRQLLENHTKY